MTAIVHAYHVKAEPPSLRDNTGDIDRLKKALAPHLQGRTPTVPFAVLPGIAERFRACGFEGRAIVNEMPGGRELVDFTPADETLLAGMALDLGTTHLEAELVDLTDGRVLAQANRENPQIVYGADILTRIHFAARGNGLDILHEAIVACVNGLAAELAEKAGIPNKALRALVVSGNTTMAHFFLRLNPYHLIREPYIPLVNAPDPCLAGDLQLHLHAGAPVWVVPSVGSYFGGDLLAGILASGLDLQEKTGMLIDVGTNAEVVVGNRDWLIACAGAAGPALEGGVARMGMRAGPGAIEHVEIDSTSGEVAYSTIDGAKPRGICGSGIIDLVAGLYCARYIDIRGKFRAAKASPRLLPGKEGLHFVVAPGAETADGNPVLLEQVDLDALMRSKAAMYAILTTLTNQVGVQFKELHRIYVAGAFGKHINPRHAITLGMLPDLPLATYVPLGNSSLAGAREILLDGVKRQRCQELVRKITYLELNVNQEFMIRFSGSRFIPHTDHTLFPSVPHFVETEDLA